MAPLHAPLTARACATVLAGGLLAGCGEQPAGDTLFPLAEGRAWTYRVTKVVGEATERETIAIANRGADRIDGAVSWRRRSDAGVEYWLRSDASGIYRIAARSPLEAEPQTDRPRRYVLQQPYAVGTAWQAPTTTYVLERRNEVPHALRHVVKPFTMSYRIDALEQAVDTPAGRFSGCVRVAGQAAIRLWDDTVRGYRLAPLSSLEWYCPGVGLVRLERTEPSPTQLMVGGSVTMELASWQ